MDTDRQTLLTEATSVITIVSILVAVGCYYAELKNLPVLAPCLFWVAVQVYHLFPALTALPGAQVPMLVGAAAAGIVFFIFTIPLAYWLAEAFGRQGIVTLERQTRVLRTRRERVRKTRRDADKFLPE